MTRGTGRSGRSGRLHRTRRLPPARGLAAAVAVAAVAAGCEAAGPADGTRPDDGLLDRPELQELVELQTRREGSALTAHLDDPDPAVRARAAFALGSVQEPTARETLEALLLEDPDARVRADAAFALGQLRDSAAAPALLEALEAEEEGEVRVEAWDALGKAGDSASLATLDVQDLEEGDRAAAALAVARFGMRGIYDEEAIRWLGRAIVADDAGLRRNAAYALSRMRDPDVWTSQLHRVRDALDAYDRDEPAAMYLVRALGNLGRPPDGGRLLEWLAEGEPWETRVEAVRALGIGRPLDPVVWSHLMDALDDPSRHVAITVAEVMAGGLQPPEAVEDMKGWIEAHPDDWRVAGPLLVSLVQHQEVEFVRAWIDRWSTADVGPWTAGLEALSYLGGEDVIRRLVEAAHSPSHRVAGPAVESLVRRWEQDRFSPATHRVYYEAFRDALETRDLRTAVAVAPALADTIFQPFGSVELLIRVYRRMAMPEDVEPMVAILSALGAAGDPEALPLLRDAADHPHAVVREAARDALAELRGGEGGARGAADGAGDAADEAAADSAGRDEGAAPEPAVRPDWALLREIGPHPRLVLETRMGRIEVELDTGEAPITVQTVARLVREGSLDGVPFHRVVPNFVIQGGDFERGDGFGGPGFSIPSEFTRIPYGRGTAGMASAGKDTEGSQYFLTHSMQPHLDGRYTAFGRVVDGMWIVDRILEGHEVVRATLEPGG